jgi:hypothetical protein
MEKSKRKPGRPSKFTQPVNRTLRFDAETDNFLASLPNASAFVREAIAEKRDRIEKIRNIFSEKLV